MSLCCENKTAAVGACFLRKLSIAAAARSKFMTVYHDNQKSVGVYLEETYLAPRPPNTKLLKRQNKRDEHKNIVVSRLRFGPLSIITTS
jgi:hypothetical protein